MLNHVLTLVSFLFVKLSFGQLDDNQLTGCANIEYQCENGMCIPNYYKCDGFNDCLDGSDETLILCANERCPSTISFQCAYGGCIEVEKKCDGQEDCIDASDEDPALCGYPIATRCQMDSYKCKRGGCIEKRKLCDGNIDCQDGSDEDSVVCTEKSRDSCEKPTKLTNARCKIIHCKLKYYIKDCTDDMDTTSGVCIELGCDEGYILEDYKMRFMSACTDGEWTPRLTYCIECGKDDRIGLHIANGFNLTRPVPWHVGFYVKIGVTYNYMCGGTIAHSKAVITAAHCVLKVNNYTNPVLQFPMSDMSVTVGKMYIDYYANETTEQKLGVADVRTRGYNRFYANDIAILILTEKININVDIMPICLEPVGDNIDWRYPSPSIRGTVVGWGKTELGRPSDHLKEASFDICCNYTVCKEKIKSEDIYARDFVSADKFCVEEENGVSVLQGDSGGGFVIRINNRHYLYGIVSVRATNTSMFTLINYHSTWVLKSLDVP